MLLFPKRRKERDGLAETAYTQFFMRFGSLEYYEGFDLPDDERYECVRRRDACISYPAPRSRASGSRS